MTTTHYLDPIFHNNKRSEFRIPSDKRVLLSGMRLCDFGVSSTKDANGANVQAFYSARTGVLGVIDRITLLSNTQVLDTFRDTAKYLTFMNLQQNSDSFKSINTFLSKTANSTEFFSNAIQIDQPISDVDNGLGLLARVNLGSLLPFLTNVSTLSDIRDLRLVIEYNTNANDVFQATRPFSFNINEPFLLVDEIVGQDAASMVNDSLNVNYAAVEVERISIPAVVANTNQVVTNRLKAFDNKIVNYLVGMTIDPAARNNIQNQNVSLAQPNEKFQFTLNGKKLLPLQGIDNEARKLAYLSDSIGDFFCIQGSNKTGLSNEQKKMYGARVQTLLGTNSYMVVDLLDRVDELQFEYRRSGTANLPAIDIFIFGVVERYVKKDKGGPLTMGYVVV